MPVNLPQPIHTTEAMLAQLPRTALLCVIDVRGQLVEVNDRLIGFTGREARDLLGHNFFSLFTAEGALDVVSRIEQKLRMGQPWHGYLRARNAQGQSVVLQTTLMLLETPADTEGVYFICQQFVADPHDLHLPDEAVRDLAARVQIMERLMAVIEFDPKGHILTANENFLAATGYTLEEVAGQHHRIFMYPEEADTLEYAAMWDQLGAGRPLTGVFRRRRKDGRPLWIMGSYNPVIGPDGHPVKLIKYVMNVTHQKELEHELQNALSEMQAQEEELRQNMEEVSAINDEMATVQTELKSVLEGIGRTTAVIEFDLTGHIQTANANFLHATGYTLDEIVGQHHRIFMYPDDAAKPEYPQMWQQLGQGKPISGVFRRRRKDGRELWIMGSYNPVLDKDGKPVKLVKYVLDVTQQKLMERDLQQAFLEKQAQEEELRQNMEELVAINDEMTNVQLELRAVLEGISRTTAVIEFDLRGHIQTANANFLAATGYTLEEIRGRHHRLFMYPEDAAKPEYADMWQQLAQGQFVSGVFRRRRKDGSTLWIMGSYNPVFDKDGKPVKLVKYVLDVTHQKELEEELQQALAETQAQEEELRQNMEEISAINDEMASVQMELRGTLEGIGRTTAVIEFDLLGHIKTANANFLAATGYDLAEIQGQHHRLFMFPEEADSPDYARMWQQLGAGHALSGVFRRRRKDGGELWIMGSYNPILDRDGKPYKLVKYVLDVTQQKQLEIQLQQMLMEKQAQEEELRQNMEEISAINDEMAEKNLTIEELNRDLKANNLQLEIAKEKLERRMNDVQLEVKESIRYAQRIQRALIPDTERLNLELPNLYRAAVLFMPRDIVSGDFYWAGPARDGRVILAVGDGTGHGVPGSFMSLLGVTTLQKHLDRGLTDPAELLLAIHTDLQKLLAQQHSDVLDSIEMLIVSLNPHGSDLRYASAMRPLYVVDGDRLSEYPYDRHSVGGRVVENDQAVFNTHEVDMQLGRCLYLMSDGIQDQFGGYGDKPRRWGRSTTKEALARLTHEVPLRKRAAALARLHTDWRGYFVDQTDDICCLMLELAETEASRAMATPQPALS
jgi:methyl-accepting chemotaxis protein